MLPVRTAAQHYSVTWKKFISNDDTKLEVIGKLNTKHSDGSGNSYWSVGCETLDRDFATFDNYKQYVGELGVGYARIQSGWAKCEQEKGKYNFEWLDTIVDGLIEEGIKPWICLCYGNPIYNNSNIDLGAKLFIKDKNATEGWCRYVEATVKRYKGKVSMYEVWNEPNLNKDISEDYAILFDKTVKSIRKYDQDVKIAGISLAGISPSQAKDILENIKKLGDLKYLDYVTFHPYVLNPDDATRTILALREVVNSYNPETMILQGETGCPSILEHGHALSYHEWTEYSQVKWDLRRMANDFMLGIPSSIFTIVDLQYKNWMLQSFGLLRMNLAQEFIYKRPSFYGVMHMINLLTTEMTPYSNGISIKSNTDKGIAFTGIKKNDNLAGIMLWYCDDIPGDSLEKDRVSLSVTGLDIHNPVLVDPITGRVYAINGFQKWNTNDHYEFKINNFPIWDSPLFIIDKSAIDFSPIL